MNEIAKYETSLAEAKQAAEAAEGGDETLNKAVEDAEKALADAKALQNDPVKLELEKEKNKKFSRRDRLNFEKRKIEEQLASLNKDEGVNAQIDADDTTPLTIGMLKQLEKDNAKKTAISIAEDIEDADERELTKHYLQTRIISSGNPQEDVKFARAAINSLKNAQIAEELARRPVAKNHSTAGGAPAKHEAEFTPTDTERVFMSAPYNMTKADVIKARNQEQPQD